MTSSNVEVRPDVRAFLESFEAATDALDVDRLRPLFAPTFMNLAPGQAGPVEREAFLQSLGARRAMFAAVQASGARMVAAWEREIDEEHVWVEGRWQLDFTADAPPGRELLLASALMLQRSAGGWRVVVYLNHHDLPAVIAALVAEREPASSTRN